MMAGARTIPVLLFAAVAAGFVSPFAGALGGGASTSSLGGRQPALTAMPEARAYPDSGDAIAALAPLLDYDAASLSLSDGDPVSSWPNGGSLGSDWDLSNTGASTTKPSYAAAGGPGGAPAVACDGGDYVGTAAAAATAIRPPLTIGFIFEPNERASSIDRSVKLGESSGGRIVAAIHDYAEDPDEHMALLTGAVGGTSFMTLVGDSAIGQWESWSFSTAETYGDPADADLNAGGLTPTGAWSRGGVPDGVLFSVCSSSPTSSSFSSDEQIARVVLLSGQRVDELEAAFATQYGDFPQ